MNRNEVLAVLKDVKQSHGKKYGILAMGLFGSVARGTNTSKSDVDVWVKLTTPNPFYLVHIKDELEQRLGTHVDIVRLREKMNPFLKSRIDSEGVHV